MTKPHTVLFTALSLLSLAACHKQNVPAITNTSAKTAKTVTIGTILCLTGDNAAYGVRQKQGIDLALEQANSAADPQGIKFKLAVEDSQWEPRIGVNAFRKMYDVDGIRHFAAICGSKIALAVCEASRQDNVVIVDAISGAPKLTTVAGPKYFRVYASDAMAGRNNVDWAEAEGAKSYAIVYVEDDWGSSYKDAMVQALREKGVQPTVVPVVLGTRDFKTEAQKIIKAKPDALFVLLYANLALPLVEQLRTQGFDGIIYGGDNLSSSDFSVAGPAVTEGVRLSLPAEPSSAEFKAFNNAFKKKFDQSPDSFALKSYDAFMILAQAIRSTDGTPGSVVNYLRKTPGYAGASGTLSFDAHGDLQNQVYQKNIYHNGKLQAFTGK